MRPMRHDPRYQEHARALRSDMTNGEKLLWSRLRAHRMDGRKFRRQHVLGRYIVDFVCLQSRLVIEIDGDSHGDDKREALDAERDAFLAKSGFRVLRFGNHSVMTNVSGVAQAILEELGDGGDAC
jgi:very-short-patch-repair endonuclease